MKHKTVGELQARVATWRHGNPARALKIIAVAGPHGKTTTALIINEMLQEDGASVATFTNKGSFLNSKPLQGGYDQSAATLHRQLQIAKKEGAYYVIVEVTDALVESNSLQTLPIEMSIITGDSTSARTLLECPANSTVLPAGFSIDDLAVAPHQIISFGGDDSAEAQIAKVTERRGGTEIEMVIDHQTRIELATYLIGQANVLNVAAAVSAAYVLAVNTISFEEGVARLERVVGNYDYLPASQLPYAVVVDGAYTDSSLELVLASAKKLKKRRLIVVADGSVSIEAYPSVARIAERMIAVNDGPEIPGVEKASTLQAALDVAMRAAKTDDLVLLVGQEFSQSVEDNITKAHQMIGEAGDNE